MKIRTKVTQTILSLLSKNSARYQSAVVCSLLGTQLSFAAVTTTTNPSDINATITLDASDAGNDIVIFSITSTDTPIKGTLDVKNNDGANDHFLSSIVGVHVNTATDSVLQFDGASISMAMTGGDSDPHLFDIYGVSANEDTQLSFKNTQISITAGAGIYDSYTYGIYGGNITSFDEKSSIKLISQVEGPTIIHGMEVQSITNFSGEISVNGIENATGLLVSSGAASASLAGTVSATSEALATALSYNGDARTIGGSYTATGSGASSAGIAAIISHGTIDTISATLNASGENAIGLGLGEAKSSTTVGTLSSTINVSAKEHAVGIAYDNNNFSTYIEEISSTITTNHLGTTYNNNTVGLVARLTTIYTDDKDGFGAFTGDIQAKGLSNAVGMELAHTFRDEPNSNESGLISGNISAFSDDTYILLDGGDTPDASKTYSREQFHFKSTAAIRIIMGELPIIPSSLTPETNADSVLHFGNGAVAKAWVGAESKELGGSYGDAIQFTTDHLVLNAASNATVTLVGDITSDSKGYDYVSNTGGDKSISSTPVSSNEYAAATTSSRQLTFNEGTYDVSSDYWFVSQVNMGSSQTKGTGHVRLHDSTNLFVTDMLTFHVNSSSDYSSIGIAHGKTLTTASLENVQITLNDDIMAEENFEINLIAGDIIDATGGELRLTLIDLNAGGTELLEDNLGSIYIIYNGEKVYYTDGMTISMDGSSTNLTIGRGTGSSHIPEPSTATLSLLALAGLISRRRRKQ